MKSLNTYLKDNKSSLISLNEKLLVNKNFKSVNTNDEFYNEFGGILSKDSNIGWWKRLTSKDMIPMKLAIEDKNAVKKVNQFFGNDDFKYIRSVSKDFEEEQKLYYDIFSFIKNNKKDLNFFYINERMNKGDYFIYLFEAGNIKVGIWGHETIKDTNKGTIVFQYIK